ncbi:ACT domain-containing protein [Neolewinella persica]|uniref:ACT domain-containing protein n=1 Tax=Neolewinella persica TaxID=70998 RepID=UPI0003630450|nr:ACT domain-containing protein [Neolewinella persica]
MPINDLAKLLKYANPELQPGTYVYVSVAEPPTVSAKDIVMSFRESEGLTLILSKQVAVAHGLDYGYEASWITMKVTSALEAVGFTAAFATALGSHHISCNVVAGYYHDHLFVAASDGERAVEILRSL